jgi:hypothetical protein
VAQLVATVQVTVSDSVLAGERQWNQSQLLSALSHLDMAPRTVWPSCHLELKHNQETADRPTEDGRQQ